MPLHMIKLAVGVPDVEWLEKRASKGVPLVVHTRMTPKRGPEMEDGGSLYWVVKGSVMARQPIMDISTIGEGRDSRCEITLEPKVIRVSPTVRRAFQGWRYLEPKDAPVDLDVIDTGETPPELAAMLRDLGAW